MITRKYRCHVKWDPTYDDDDIELPTTFYAHLSFDREPTDEDINDSLVDMITDEIGYCISSLSYKEV